MYLLLSCERLELCCLPVQVRDAQEHEKRTWKTFWLDHTNTSLGQKDFKDKGQEEWQIEKHFALNSWTVAIRVWKEIYSEKSILTKWLKYISQIVNRKY